MILFLVLLLAADVGRHGEDHARLAALDRQIEARPDDVNLRLRRAALHRRHDDPRAAAADLAHARAVDPSVAAVHLGEAGLALEDGALGQARESLDRALLRSPRSSAAWALLARCAEVEEDWQAAAVAWTRSAALRTLPRADEWAQAARCWENLAETGEALAVLESGMRVTGGAFVLELRALACERSLGRIEAALARCDRLAARSARAEAWEMRRAELLMDAGRWTAASAALDAAQAALDALPARTRTTRAVRDMQDDLDRLRTRLVTEAAS